VSVVTHLTESFLVFRRLFSDVLECYHKNEKRKTKEPDKPKRKVVKAINQSWSKRGSREVSIQWANILFPSTAKRGGISFNVIGTGVVGGLNWRCAKLGHKHLLWLEISI